MSNLQLSDKMREELYEEAQTNGLNAREYKSLLRAVDELINQRVLTSDFMTKNAGLDYDYDINGEEEK